LAAGRWQASIFDFDKIRCQLPDFGILHDEDITEHGVEETASPSGAAHRTFGYNHVVFLGHARDPYFGTADESRILDFPVKSIFARQVKCAGHEPFNVIGQARQDLPMIASGETFHILLHCLFVLAHGLPVVHTKDGVVLPQPEMESCPW
jgi:hypothetical protein